LGKFMRIAQFVICIISVITIVISLLELILARNMVEVTIKQYKSKLFDNFLLSILVAVAGILYYLIRYQ